MSAARHDDAAEPETVRRFFQNRPAGITADHLTVVEPEPLGLVQKRTILASVQNMRSDIVISQKYRLGTAAVPVIDQFRRRDDLGGDRRIQPQYRHIEAKFLITLGPRIERVLVARRNRAMGDKTAPVIAGHEMKRGRAVGG